MGFAKVEARPSIYNVDDVKYVYQGTRSGCNYRTEGDWLPPEDDALWFEGALGNQRSNYVL